MAQRKSSTGGIIAVVIGIVAVVGGIGYALWHFMGNKSKTQQSKDRGELPENKDKLERFKQGTATEADLLALGPAYWAEALASDLSRVCGQNKKLDGPLVPQSMGQAAFNVAVQETKGAYNTTIDGCGPKMNFLLVEVLGKTGRPKIWGLPA